MNKVRDYLLGMNFAWFCAILLLSNISFSNDMEWKSLGKSGDGTKETFVDLSSIQFDGDIRRGSSRVVVTPHSQTGAGKYANRWISYFTYRFAFKCAEKVGRIEAFSVYFDDGTAYDDPVSDYPKPWRTTVQGVDTNWPTLAHVVCARPST
jgi:hypothetical protein